MTNEIKGLAIEKFHSDTSSRREETSILRVRISFKERKLRKQKFIWLKARKSAEGQFGAHWLRNEDKTEPCLGG